MAPGISDPQDQIVIDNLVPGTRGMAEIHGSIADGMLGYALAAFNQSWRADGNVFKGVNWAARIDFCPTMWGFSPSYNHSLLGEKDVMNLGVGYVYEKNTIGFGTNYAST